MKPIPPKARIIISCVSKETGVPVEAILGRHRTKETALARQIVYYIMSRVFTNLSLSAVSKFLRRDHTTLLHGVAVMRERIEADEQFCKSVRAIEVAVSDAIATGLIPRQAQVEKPNRGFIDRNGAIICGV